MRRGFVGAITAASAATVVAMVLLPACSSVVGGTGRGATPTGTGTGTHTDFSTNSDAPPSTNPAPTDSGTSTGTPRGDTAIGNARTADLCPGLDPAAFAKYGQPGTTYRATPVECDFQIPKGGQAIHLSAYVTGATASSTSGPSRTIAGLAVYNYTYVASDHHCRATVVATGVAVTVNASDQSATESPTAMCAMRDLLANQVAQSITAGRITHTAYGSNSLTSLSLCRFTDVSPLRTAPLATGLVAQEYALGNECDLFNSVYSIYVYVGLEQAPVYAHQGGRQLSTGGHTLYLMYDTSSTKDYCRLVSSQAQVPGTENVETLEASVDLATDAPPAAASGAALCNRLLAPLLVYVLDKMGRK